MHARVSMQAQRMVLEYATCVPLVLCFLPNGWVDTVDDKLVLDVPQICSCVALLMRKSAHPCTSPHSSLTVRWYPSNTRSRCAGEVSSAVEQRPLGIDGVICRHRPYTRLTHPGILLSRRDACSS